MASNRVRKDAYSLSVVCSHPATPAAGDPVRYGQKTGVALTDESDAGNASGYTSVYFGPSQWTLTVDDNEGTGIAVGDPIYYHDTGTGTGSVNLNNSATGADAYFGTADEAVSANATTAIKVTHEPLGAMVTIGSGLSVLRVARATFDPSGDSDMRTVAAHTLTTQIPDNAIVVGGFVDVVTTFTSADDSATVAIHVQSANDIVSAIAISNGGNPWDAGLHAIVPKANTPESTGIKMTADRTITATVGTQALTAGKAEIFLYYIQSS